jgi:hypothetical protein
MRLERHLHRNSKLFFVFKGFAPARSSTSIYNPPHFDPFLNRIGSNGWFRLSFVFFSRGRRKKEKRKLCARHVAKVHQSSISMAIYILYIISFCLLFSIFFLSSRRGRQDVLQHIGGFIYHVRLSNNIEKT